MACLILLWVVKPPEDLGGSPVQKTTITMTWGRADGTTPMDAPTAELALAGALQNSGRRDGSLFTAATVRSWSSMTAGASLP